MDTMHRDTATIEQRQSSATFRPRSTAPRVARRMLRELARQSQLPARVVDDAAFVLGELVTMSLDQVGSRVAVLVVLDDHEITVRVRDGGTDARALRHDHTAGAIRRWDVVKRLAASWGYTRDGVHRELWATLRTDRELVAA
jgi:anti-sigma regulatory factor (Ser/Thr protein kinase)